jgi:hypothetical protein
MLSVALSSLEVEFQVLHNLYVADRHAVSATRTQLVLWRSPMIGWMKVNTDGSLTSVSAVSGGLFRDYMANYHGGFAKKIDTLSVFHAELMALILAMELVHSNNWNCFWLVSDSPTALCAFDDINLLPRVLRNRWSNCLSLGLHLQ